jgi:hypothetical protein
MNLAVTLFPKRFQNYTFLREICDAVGHEVEAWSSQRLRLPAEELSFTREVNRLPIVFSIETYDQSQSGDLHICIDVKARLPLFPFPSPSYVFWKRPNGTVYY